MTWPSPADLARLRSLKAAGIRPEYVAAFAARIGATPFCARPVVPPAPSRRGRAEVRLMVAEDKRARRARRAAG